MGDGDYHLTVLRQLGSQVSDLTLDLQFDKNVVSALPSEPIPFFGDRTYHYDGQLREDQDFVIKFK